MYLKVFSYSKYVEFISHLKSQGPISTFRDWDGSNCFLLRHDVDFDISLAHRLSQIEKDQGIRSSFFILVSGDTYNPLSLTNRRLLLEMADSGFEIGLHFDPTIYPFSNDGDLEKYVKNEAQLLESVVHRPVKSVSLHNPSVHGQFPIFQDFINAYDPKYFNDACYISDSRMNFGKKEPFEFVKAISRGPIQVLLHPMHYSESGHSYPNIMSEHICRYTRTIHNNFSVNSTYREQVGHCLATTIRNLNERL